MSHSRPLKRAQQRRCASRIVAAASCSYAAFLGTRAPGIRTLLSGLLVLALAASPARASVEGSPHDLIAQGYDVQKASLLQERCSRCHLPSTPLTQGFLPDVPPVLERRYGAPSLGCFSCHDGTTIVSPDVDASRTAFHPASHGIDLEGYEGLRSEEVGLPYLAGKRMECVTCHDPHDDGRRPFLRVDLQEICLACHSRYAEFGRGKENRTGNHILAVDVAVSSRPEVPLRVAEPFLTAFPSPYPLESGRGSGGWHWELGGHLSKGRTGGVGCGTCHAVHGSEDSAPLEKLLTVAPVNEVANLFCEGCHAGARGDGRLDSASPNPGGTSTGRTYHPADDDEANGSVRLLEIREPPQWPFGSGKPRRLLCTTCHTPHAALAQTSLLRPPPTAPGFCEECHDQVPVYHHQIAPGSGGGCTSQIPPPPYGTARVLTCASCHQAHNAGLGKPHEEDFTPLLRASARNGALCEQCHPPANPTCGQRTEYRASHFVGDPTLPDTYDDKAPPLRLDPWPESGLASVYGGETNQTLACLSCHGFRKGVLASGDTGKSRHLLARSGNLVEWGEGQEAVYLCTGCHSIDPVTGQVKGHTHPTMKADIAKQGMTVTLPMSATPAGHLNCDSCHRPHEAANRGGRYILEAANGSNTDPLTIHPQTDYTGVCHGCHDPGKY